MDAETGIPDGRERRGLVEKGKDVARREGGRKERINERKEGIQKLRKEEGKRHGEREIKREVGKKANNVLRREIEV